MNKAATQPVDGGMHLFIPFTKVHEEPDGSVIVEGIATSEALDSQGEVVLYDASVKAFSEWGEWFQKATNGESLGNIREMHGPVAAGKAIAWGPIEEKRAIALTSKIVDPIAAKKCRERVYTGYSIASPGDRVKRGTAKVGDKNVPAVIEYTLGEVSVVDRGACPDAVFTLVKRDGGGAIQKDHASALTAAQSAEDALRAFVQEMALLEGDPAVWDLRMMVEALAQVCAAKHSIASEVVADQAAAAANGGEGAEGGDTGKAAAPGDAKKQDDPAPAAPAAEPVQKIEPSDALQKLLAGQEDLTKAVGQIRTVQEETSKRMQGIEGRIDTLEKAPKPPGRPVDKTLGSTASSAVQVTFNDMEQAVAKLEATGQLDEATRVSLRKALAAASLMRRSR